MKQASRKDVRSLSVVPEAPQKGLIDAQARLRGLVSMYLEALSPRSRMAYGADFQDFADWLAAQSGSGVEADLPAGGQGSAEGAQGHSKAVEGDVGAPDQPDHSGRAVPVHAMDPQTAMQTLISQDQGVANEMVMRYRNHLMNVRKLAPATINRRLAAVKSIVKFARMMGVCPWTLEVRRIKSQPYRDTLGVGKDAVVRVLKDLEAKDDPKSIRDRAIIRLLYNQGLRRGEVAALDLANLEREKSRLTIMGKGRTEPEKITLTPKTLKAIEDWIAVRDCKSASLFRNFDPAEKGERLTDTSIYRIVKGYGLKRPHGIRHSAITQILDKNGGNLREAAKFSRHKNIQTLLIYDDNRKDLGGKMANLLDEDS